MAGVRGDLENAIVAPRGLPQDLSVLTAHNVKRWESDCGHSYSWLNAVEVAALATWYEDGRFGQYGFFEMWLGTYLFGHGFEVVANYPDIAAKEGVEDVRFVFWFDN